MDTDMVLISREQVEYMVLRLRRAAGFCEKARSPSRKPSMDELNEEPTAFYSGATGFSGATMRQIVFELEQQML